MLLFQLKLEDKPLQILQKLNHVVFQFVFYIQTLALDISAFFLSSFSLTPYEHTKTIQKPHYKIKYNIAKNFILVIYY